MARCLLLWLIYTGGLPVYYCRIPLFIGTLGILLLAPAPGRLSGILVTAGLFFRSCRGISLAPVVQFCSWNIQSVEAPLLRSFLSSLRGTLVARFFVQSIVLFFLFLYVLYSHGYSG